MRPQYLMGAFGIFVIGTLLSCIASRRWLLAGEMDIFRALASMNAVSFQAGGTWDIPKGISMYWSAIVTAFSWNYPYLSSEWALFVKIPLWIVSVGVIWGLIEFSVSVIQGLVGFARTLTGG